MKPSGKIIRKLKGIVVSDKMNQTAVVKVDYFKKHPRYLKYYRQSQRFKAHNKDNQFKEGDSVLIQACRPLSKDKCWKIISQEK